MKDLKILGYSVHKLLLRTRAGHPRFFRAFALASAKQKKAREREEKKARKKAKAPSAKEKKREFTLFCLWGVVGVCLCVWGVCTYVCGGVCMCLGCLKRPS